MTILEQCKEYNANEEFQETIDLINTLKECELTAEIHSEIAYVLINLAGSDKKLYKEALTYHLLPFSDEMRNDHCWNYRVAYCYLELESEGYALDYFQQALDARPGDEDTLKMIEKCTKIISLPRFDNNFRLKVKKAWEEFGKEESNLLLALEKNDQVLFEKTYRKIMNPIWQSLYYKIYTNGKKYVIELSIDRLETNIYLLDYIKSNMPEDIGKRWEISIGRKAQNDIKPVEYKDGELSLEDLSFSFEQAEPSHIHIKSESVELSDDDDDAYIAVDEILTSAFGEIPSIQIAKTYDFIPQESEYHPLSELPELYRKRYAAIEPTADEYINNYEYSYSFNDFDNLEVLRDDIFSGLSKYDDMLECYNNDETYLFDALYSNGIVPGFFAIPTEYLGKKTPAQDGLEILSRLEKCIEPEFARVTGSAFGGAFFYMDILAYDLPPVVAKARDFFSENGFEGTFFQVFRRDANAISLT